MLSTSSRSFVRSRPLSTNTHVSRSPIALWISAAATDESTPPDSPQITRLSPTRSRIRSASISANSLIRQLPSHPQISYTKFRRMSVPCGVCVTSGWNCTPVNALSAERTAAYAHVAVAAIGTSPAAFSPEIWSACDIHTDVFSGIALNTGVSPMMPSDARPNSR